MLVALDCSGSVPAYICAADLACAALMQAAPEALFGVNRWDTAELQSDAERVKLLRLMVRAP